MFGENKNLKDPEGPRLGGAIGAGSSNVSVISYTKTNKLITALYMVTDIIDKDEPLRNKLRTLGIEIVSDINLIQQNNIGHLASALCSKISQIMSFLELASTINIVSEMNSNILKKEFLELDQSIKDSGGKDGLIDRKVNLSEFFKEELPAPRQSVNKGQYKSIGHQHFTRIGVQKGSTLMKALSDKTLGLSDMNTKIKNTNNFDILKKQRREDIINIIKIIGGNSTIKDIKDKIKTEVGQSSSLVSYGEKTLQRELVSMVKDGVLNKTGEKRWSRYFLKN